MFKHFFNRFAVCASLVAASSVCADTTTIWVVGVTQEDGWYDVNKSFDGTDDKLCWAASASNLIAWWQHDYSVRYDIPNTKEDIWNTFKTNVTKNDGGDTQAAIQWWLTGVYVPLNKEQEKRSVFSIETESILPEFSGYYYTDSLPGNNGYDCSMYGFYWTDQFGNEVGTEPGVYHFLCMDKYSGVEVDGKTSISRAFNSELLLELIGQGCGFGLGVSFEGVAMGHALTLWGLEKDENMNITAMYLTDSDDKKTELLRVETYTQDGEFYLASGENGYYQGAKVDTLFAINPTAAEDWPNENLVVPEPSGAALGVLALAGLAARRRRNEKGMGERNI